MSVLDFIIGASLMNAMPHYILGVWKGKMLSGFGTGNTQNILWALANFALSIGLFIYKYGTEGFISNPIYLGAVFILMVFFITSWFWYKYFNK